MKAQANQIRPGWVIEYNGKPCSVIKIQIITPGKGGAFIQVDMRDVETGVKTNQRWRTADTVEKLMSEERDCTFMFSDGETLNFMDKETFDQFTVPRDLLGDRAAFLQDNMEVIVEFIEGKPVNVELPTNVVQTVVETEPALKGQTVTSSYKPALLDNGLRIGVPPFITTGEKIVVATEDCTYVERAK